MTDTTEIAPQMPTMEQLSERAVRAFVKSVLAVDDNITMNPEESVELPADDDTPLTATPGPADEVGEDLDEDEDDERPPPAIADARGGLQGAALTDAFARAGVVCGLLSVPDRENIVKVARRADVLIIDWDLGDDGELTREVIGELAGSQPESEGRPDESLRLVVIYTNEDPELVDSTLLKELEDLKPARAPAGGLRFENQLVVDVLRKGTAKGSVRADEVPDEVFKRLARAVPGLVQAAALLAMAALRENAHRLVNAFPPEFDLGYVGHRAALGDKEEAVGQVVSVIANELRALLEDHGPTAAAVGPEAVAAWVLAMERTGNWPEAIPTTKKDSKPRMSPETLAAWIEQTHSASSDGLPSDWIPATGTFRSNGRVTELIAGPDVSIESDRLWAMALGQRRVYADAVRQLTLGTVVKRRPIDGEETDDKWFICLQPVCDAVRIYAKQATDDSPAVSPLRRFLLLPLQQLQDDKGSDINVQHGDQWVSLCWQTTKTYQLTSEVFDAQDRGRVVAIASEGYRLRSTSAECHYWWAGQLNNAHAQRLATDFAGKLGRAGVDEAEWQRNR
jgi:hypothetical protein